MMPCNVVVRRDPEDEGHVLVEALNPAMMVDFAGDGDDAGLAEVAADAASRVAAAVAALAGA